MPLVDVEVAASNRCQEAGLSLDEAPPRDEQDLHRLANETTVLVTGISGRVIGYFSVFPLACLHLELPAVDRA